MAGKQQGDALGPVVDALDEISWEWLREYHPRLAESIQTAVQAGTSPIDVKWKVLHHTQRIELALRCWQAARYLAIGRD